MTDLPVVHERPLARVSLPLSAAQLAAMVATAPQDLAQRLKAWPSTVLAPRPIDEAISTAGGVRFDAIDSHGMLRALPGVFVAGEMVDWEAPTGGYLLSACVASGVAAGRGLLAWQAAAGPAAPSPNP
jgi:predicted flavoprotein YhiN